MFLELSLFSNTLAVQMIFGKNGTSTPFTLSLDPHVPIPLLFTLCGYKIHH